MEEKKPMITAFLSVFENNLSRLKDDLKTELHRAKTDRRKDWIKNQIKEIKSLRKTVREMQAQDGRLECCPHCGGSLR